MTCYTVKVSSRTAVNGIKVTAALLLCFLVAKHAGTLVSVLLAVGFFAAVVAGLLACCGVRWWPVAPGKAKDPLEALYHIDWYQFEQVTGRSPPPSGLALGGG